MTCYFGVDGGGTCARIRIVNEEGAAISQVSGGSTNLFSVPEETVFSNLRTLITTGCEEAQIPLSALRGGCLGSAGLNRPAERALMQAFFHELLGESCPVYLCNDGEILLVGGLKAYSGYCLIGGTGSLALARSEDGILIRAGGLGYMLGDEGSACWIGWQAVCRTLRSLEGRDLETDMLPALLSYFSLNGPEDFVALMHHRFSKPQVGGAAPLVEEYAKKGDPLAVDLCQKAALELYQLCDSVIRRMPLDNGRLAFSGGVLEHNELVRDTLLAHLHEAYPQISVVLTPGAAVDGACMLAMRTAPASS